MQIAKKVTIVPIPLVYYHGEILWGDYTLYSGARREEIKNRANAGAQIPAALEKALADTSSDIIFVVDDKFNYERGQGIEVDHDKIEAFCAAACVPDAWRPELIETDVLSRIVRADPKMQIGYADGSFSFSERKLYEQGKKKYLIDGECAIEWSWLLHWIEKKGYQHIQAYIPRMCYKGLCYSTQYSQESGECTAFVSITFTGHRQKDASTEVHFSAKSIAGS